MLLTTVFDALVVDRNHDVPVPFSVLGPYGSSAGRLSARLNHRHRSFFALELWRPHNLIHERYLNDLVDLLDGGHCLCTTWRISTVFKIFLIVGICFCALGCTAGVFVTLSNCRNLNLKHLYCSLLDLFAS